MFFKINSTLLAFPAKLGKKPELLGIVAICAAQSLWLSSQKV
jgi:hypothetical protein